MEQLIKALKLIKQGEVKEVKHNHDRGILSLVLKNGSKKSYTVATGGIVCDYVQLLTDVKPVYVNNSVKWNLEAE